MVRTVSHWYRLTIPTYKGLPQTRHASWRNIRQNGYRRGPRSTLLVSRSGQTIVEKVLTEVITNPPPCQGGENALYYT